MRMRTGFYSWLDQNGMHDIIRIDDGACVPLLYVLIEITRKTEPLEFLFFHFSIMMMFHETRDNAINCDVDVCA